MFYVQFFILAIALAILPAIAVHLAVREDEEYSFKKAATVSIIVTGVEFFVFYWVFLS